MVRVDRDEPARRHVHGIAAALRRRALGDVQVPASLACLASHPHGWNMTAARILRRAVPDVGGWPDAMHPVLRRIYAARGIAVPNDVEHRLAALLAPQQLGGIARACELLEAALRSDAHICVVGDFDCDGATGTAVAVRGLRLLGAKNVNYAVPNRFRHGYGLSPAIVAELLPQRPQLLVT